MPDRILRQDFEHLSLVARMILEDRLEELREQLRRAKQEKRTAQQRSGGPFKVWSGQSESEVVEDDENEDQEADVEPPTSSNPFASRQE